MENQGEEPFGWRNSMCKGPEVGKHMASSRGARERATQSNLERRLLKYTIKSFPSTFSDVVIVETAL